MAEIVRMPKLSDTMTDGVVAKWHKKVGDKVKSGEILAEIETDKATMEFESFVDGTLLHIGVPEKGTAPVDAVLAIFGEKGEDISALLSGGTAPKMETKKEVVEVVAETKSQPTTKAVDTSNIKAKVVRMPKLSDTMTDGVVAKWHKKVGDKVASGDLLADIETDKATMEFESFEDGYLLHIGIAEGGSAPVDSVLAVIGEKGADFKALLENSSQAPVVSSQPSIESPKPETRSSQPAPITQTPSPTHSTLYHKELSLLH
jgi:pyruvate dehydrogenase E2 component (dihydrolipoamide acetyltransferase)